MAIFMQTQFLITDQWTVCQLCIGDQAAQSSGTSRGSDQLCVHSDVFTYLLSGTLPAN
jgi:hypothetical protein